MRFASIVEDLGHELLLVAHHADRVPADPLGLSASTSPSCRSSAAFRAASSGSRWSRRPSARCCWPSSASACPGLQFENQRVEAAYRKELVYGEDNADRAEPPTVRELFANVQKNYFRLYFHYTYFNIARYAYLQGAAYIPLLAMSPSILAGTLTLGLYQQISNAFGQVVGLVPVPRPRLDDDRRAALGLRAPALFESFIPQDQEPIKEELERRRNGLAPAPAPAHKQKGRSDGAAFPILRSDSLSASRTRRRGSVPSGPDTARRRSAGTRT